MNPQQPSSAPQMPTAQQNPYDFILNTGQPAPKGKINLPTGNSGLQRVLFFAGGLVVLMIIFMIFLSLISGGGGQTTKLISIAQDQTELIRIADLAENERTVRLSSTKDLSANVSISLTSDKLKTLSLVGAKKVGAKQLALKQSSKSDALLKSAAANNQFDSVFVDLLTTKLKSYQTEVKSAYNASKKTKEKAILADAYSGVTILLDQDTTN